MRAIACVRLEYQGKEYYFEDEWGQYDGWSEDDYRRGIEFWWEDGNGSCDCNRSINIRRYCDPAFPEMECGDLIELISVSANITE